VDKLYGYGHGQVLFKPTEAADLQFRPMACDCMSYFVGGDAVTGGFKEDEGFAINGGKGWSNVVFDNHMIEVSGSTAIAMGNYYLTCATTGSVTKLEYTFGYKKCRDGKVRIMLHHSSVPYSKSTLTEEPKQTESNVLDEMRASLSRAYYKDSFSKERDDAPSRDRIIEIIKRLNKEQTAEIKAEIMAEVRQEVLAEVESLRKDLKHIELESAAQQTSTRNRLLKEMKDLNDKQTAEIEAKIESEGQQEVLASFVDSLRKDFRAAQQTSTRQLAKPEVLRGSTDLEVDWASFGSKTGEKDIKEALAKQVLP
jgi:hypothetical protein